VNILGSSILKTFSKILKKEASDHTVNKIVELHWLAVEKTLKEKFGDLTLREVDIAKSSIKRFIKHML